MPDQKEKQQKSRETVKTVAQTGDLVLAKESSSNVERDGSSGKLEHEQGTSPWKIAVLLRRGPDNQRSPELAMYPSEGSKPFHARPPDLRHPLDDEVPQIHIVNGY